MKRNILTLSIGINDLIYKLSIINKNDISTLNILLLKLLVNITDKNIG